MNELKILWKNAYELEMLILGLTNGINLPKEIEKKTNDFIEFLDKEIEKNVDNLEYAFIEEIKFIKGFES